MVFFWYSEHLIHCFLCPVSLLEVSGLTHWQVIHSFSLKTFACFSLVLTVLRWTVLSLVVGFSLSFFLCLRGTLCWRGSIFLWFWQFYLHYFCPNISSSLGFIFISLGDYWGFPGGSVVKTPCSQGRGTGLISGRGTKVPHVGGVAPPKSMSFGDYYNLNVEIFYFPRHS